MYDNALSCVPGVPSAVHLDEYAAHFGFDATPRRGENCTENTIDVSSTRVCVQCIDGWGTVGVGATNCITLTLVVRSLAFLTSVK